MLYHFGVENIVVYYIFSILHSTNGELLQRSLLEVKVESRVASSHFTPLVPPRLPPPPSSNKSNVVKLEVAGSRAPGGGVREGRCLANPPRALKLCHTQLKFGRKVKMGSLSIHNLGFDISGMILYCKH